MTTIFILIGFAALLFGAFKLAPKGWRTVFMNGVASVAAFATGIMPTLMDLPWIEVVDRAEAALIGMVLMTANAIARMVTDTPVGKKAPD